MLGLLLVQSFLAPFVDPVSNASEWTSRAGYLVVALIGLSGALNLKGHAALQGGVLYTCVSVPEFSSQQGLTILVARRSVYALTYGLNICPSIYPISYF